MYNVQMARPVIDNNQSLVVESHSKASKQIFHLSLSALNIEEIRNFYEVNFACNAKRISKSDQEIHIDFFGHQLTFVQVSLENHRQVSEPNEPGYPLVHFGAALPYYLWFNLKKRLEQNNVNFFVEPHLKFEGQLHEHYVMLVKDPSENVIEIKSFTQTNDWL